MVLEKCVGREISDCHACGEDKITLVDRRGAAFPVLRTFDHRSLVVNSIPTGMSDQPERLGSVGKCGKHFIFTVETREQCERVIRAYREGKPLEGPVRRIQ